MAEQLWHIERINDTQANGITNLDPLQIMIFTDQDKDFAYKDSAGTLHVVAEQKYYDSSWHYSTPDFGSINLLDIDALGSAPDRIVVLDASGIGYTRTPAQLASDLGVGSAVDGSGTAKYGAMWSDTDTLTDSWTKFDTNTVATFGPADQDNLYLDGYNCKVSNADAARNVQQRFIGYKADATLTVLSTLEARHYGTGDDYLSELLCYVNDNASPTGGVTVFRARPTELQINLDKGDIDFIVNGDTGEIFRTDATNDNILVGTSTADTTCALKVLSASKANQLKLAYSTSVSDDFACDSTGTLSVVCNDTTTADLNITVSRNVNVTLGDAAGADSLYVKDSAGTAIMSINSDGDLYAARDIYTTAWTDYSGTATIVGWQSTDLVKYVWYKKIGKMAIVQFSISGTSDSTATTFTLPAAMTPKSGGLDAWGTIRRADNGTFDIGTIYVPPNNPPTVALYPDAAGGNWTNSGAKWTQGVICYECNA